MNERDENRRLERATAEYFERLSARGVTEENDLGRFLSDAAKGVDFDREL